MQIEVIIGALALTAASTAMLALAHRRNREDRERLPLARLIERGDVNPAALGRQGVVAELARAAATCAACPDRRRCKVLLDDGREAIVETFCPNRELLCRVAPLKALA